MVFQSFLIITVIGSALASVIPLKEPVGHAQPYKFGYSIKDKHGEQHREEAGNGAGIVEGNYGFTDDRGIARQVNYVADHAGFRARVKTNEPGTAQQSPAAVQMISNDPYSQGASGPYVSRPGSPVVAGLGQANPVVGLLPGYGGYGVGGYGLPYSANAYGYGGLGLGYGGLLGGLGYGGVVNYGAPLVGGAISGFDSRFVTV